MASAGSMALPAADNKFELEALTFLRNGDKDDSRWLKREWIQFVSNAQYQFQCQLCAKGNMSDSYCRLKDHCTSSMHSKRKRNWGIMPDGYWQSGQAPAGWVYVEDRDRAGPQDAGLTEAQNAGRIEPHDAGCAQPHDAGHTQPQDAGQTEPQDAGHTQPQDAGQMWPQDVGRTEPQDSGPTRFTRPPGLLRSIATSSEGQPGPSAASSPQEAIMDQITSWFMQLAPASRAPCLTHLQQVIINATIEDEPVLVDNDDL